MWDTFLELRKKRMGLPPNKKSNADKIVGLRQKGQSLKQRLDSVCAVMKEKK